MLKKNLIILFIFFCIICISNVCFANNMGNSIKNGVSSITNTVVDGTQNLANGIRNGVGNMENGIEGALTMDNNTSTNTNTTMTTTDNYTATRTATTRAATDDTGLFGLDSSTMWIWAIVAIAAIGIIGLVWYYGSQNRVD